MAVRSVRAAWTPMVGTGHRCKGSRYCWRSPGRSPDYDARPSRFAMLSRATRGACSRCEPPRRPSFIGLAGGRTPAFDGARSCRTIAVRSGVRSREAASSKRHDAENAGNRWLRCRSRQRNAACSRRRDRVRSFPFAIACAAVGRRLLGCSEIGAIRHRWSRWRPGQQEASRPIRCPSPHNTSCTSFPSRRGRARCARAWLRGGSARAGSALRCGGGAGR